MAGPLEMGEDELRNRLLQFDRAVGLLYPGRDFRLVFVGGGAMVLLGCLSRATSDLDALLFPQELLALMEEYDLSCRARAYIDQFAPSLEDRLVPIVEGTRSIECYSASLEDLVASKLYSERERDSLDIRRPEVLDALDWNRLADVVNDMGDGVLIERRYRELLRDYSAYRKEFGPCDS